MRLNLSAERPFMWLMNSVWPSTETDGAAASTAGPARPEWASWYARWHLANLPHPDHDRSLTRRLLIAVTVVYAGIVARRFTGEFDIAFWVRSAMVAYMAFGAAVAFKMDHLRLRRFVTGLALLLPATAAWLTRDASLLYHVGATALAIMTPAMFLQSAKDLAIVAGGLLPTLFFLAHGSGRPEAVMSIFTVWAASLLLALASTFVVLLNRGWLVKVRRDVAEARDAAVESARVRSEFLANMSHEIRTPMNGVLGTLDLLGTSELNEEQFVQLEVVRQSGKDLLDIINEILDFARIDAGRLELADTSFSPAECVRSVAQLLTSTAASKQVVLDAHIGFDDAIVVRGDRLRFRQALMNLVGNAIKFTDTGAVRISADLVERDPSSTRIRVSIQDSGRGMTKAELDRVFEPFIQADGTLRRRHQGTGLGLAITQRIVDAMGGKIDVSSVPDEGSTFRLTVPFITTDESLEQPAARPPVTSLAPDSDSPVVVLLVEDNRINQRVAAAMLERLGCTCIVADDGEDALAKAEESRFDLILMDCQMPGLDGYEATERLRAKPGWFRDVPIVALTAQALIGDRDRCLAVGMNDYIAKPVLLEELGKTLSRHLPHRRRFAARSGVDVPRT